MTKTMARILSKLAASGRLQLIHYESARSFDEGQREPTIYLLPECDTEEDVRKVLTEPCEEIFAEQPAGWSNDDTTWPQDRSTRHFSLV